MNYTQPDDPNHIDSPKDWLYSALVFSRALGLIIHDGEGVVVDLFGDAKQLYPKGEKVIVHRVGNQIKITDISERKDLNEGDVIMMIDKDDNLN